jgi:hypothetical protein
MLQYLKEKPTDCFGISQQKCKTYSGENGNQYFDAIVDGNDVTNANRIRSILDCS